MNSSRSTARKATGIATGIATGVAVVAVASISLLPSTAQAKPWTAPVASTPANTASHHRVLGPQNVHAQPEQPPATRGRLDRAPRFRFERIPT
jgi:hypothetical protein